MNKKETKKTYYQCKTCGDEIFSDTKKVMTWCGCGAMGIDGCEGYIRIIGDKDNAVLIKK
jgi:peptide methionine sulfoxide reductase MsrB